MRDTRKPETNTSPIEVLQPLHEIFVGDTLDAHKLTSMMTYSWRPIHDTLNSQMGIIIYIRQIVHCNDLPITFRAKLYDKFIELLMFLHNL